MLYFIFVLDQQPSKLTVTLIGLRKIACIFLWIISSWIPGYKKIRQMCVPYTNYSSVMLEIKVNKAKHAKSSTQLMSTGHPKLKTKYDIYRCMVLCRWFFVTSQHIQLLLLLKNLKRFWIIHRHILLLLFYIFSPLSIYLVKKCNTMIAWFLHLENVLRISGEKIYRWQKYST